MTELVSATVIVKEFSDRHDRKRPRWNSDLDKM